MKARKKYTDTATYNEAKQHVTRDVNLHCTDDFKIKLKKRWLINGYKIIKDKTHLCIWMLKTTVSDKESC